LNHMENDRTAVYLSSRIKDTELGSIGIKLDRIAFASEFSNSEAMMLSEEEEKLEVETGMLDENYFMTTTSNDETVQTEEEKLEVEDWMLDGSHFPANKANLNSVEDMQRTNCRSKTGCSTRTLGFRS